MKKITMQTIADQLNISRVTVWKVHNNYPGVSDSLRKKILDKSRELGYEKLRATDDEEDYNIEIPNNSNVEKTTISVIVCRPESSIFWMDIIHNIAKTLSLLNINLMYTYLPTKVGKDYKLPDILVDGTVQGTIVLNVYDYNILSLINNLEIPKVFLDMVPTIPVSKLTGDLVLLEGYHAIFNITENIIKKGRKEIGFIGDINYAVTNHTRYEGYVAAMEKNDLAINKDFCLTHSIGIYSYAEEINDFLSKLDKLPEAFVCASDFIANFVLDYLKRNNYSVPKDIAISGYDDSREYTHLSGDLTTVQVRNAALGERLVRQLLYRIEHPDYPTETINIQPKILFKKSTDF
ncbi:substrate-binding domain-containing protein [Vallitalea guaymasensis]|uniref:LacI family DNA-binding transcriptional regulator n=1 Tax=Vallitalea guaymasensis TaxID=1185412 RepID=A0A8J8MBG5_9FIRM|nr:substrate-binding domain-containing protein [Vallitalea guaymasensis]QUH29896.1 LacI family DNA-binding transcriptional regulator [Vallitalea guaymasensis]